MWEFLTTGGGILFGILLVVDAVPALVMGLIVGNLMKGITVRAGLVVGLLVAIASSVVSLAYLYVFQPDRLFFPAGNPLWVIDMALVFGLCWAIRKPDDDSSSHP